MKRQYSASLKSTSAQSMTRVECEENQSTNLTKRISSSVPKDLRASSKLFIVTRSRFLVESTDSLMFLILILILLSLPKIK